MNHYRVPARLIPDLWPALELHAARACRHHPFVQAPDLLVILLAGRGQLFLSTGEGGILGFAACEMVEYPRRRVANVLAAAGARGFMSVLTGPLLDLMQQWAVEQGADTFAVTGRPGWIRVAQRRGAHALTYCVAWEGLDHVRRRRYADHQLRALEAGPAVSSGHLPAGKPAL